ncbi:MAG: phosphatase PAP2 family protein [Terrimesophilobacter sp.]
MRRPKLRRAAILVVSAVVLAGAFVAVTLFFVTTHWGQSIDQSAFNGAKLGQRTVAPPTLFLLDALPIVGIASAAIFAIIVTVTRRNWSVLIVALSTALVANLLTQVLKNFLISRPDLGVHGFADNSLPSGHTTLAASAALVVFLVASPRRRPLMGTLGAVFTAAVGVSTLANQWHRPSDVIASMLLVAFFGCIAGLVLLGPRFSTNDLRTDRWSRALLLLTLPCAGFAIATVFIAGLSPIAYLGAATSIIGCAFLLAAAANHAFRTVL